MDIKTATLEQLFDEIARRTIAETQKNLNDDFADEGGEISRAEVVTDFLQGEYDDALKEDFYEAVRRVA